jgi:Transposase.
VAYFQYKTIIFYIIPCINFYKILSFLQNMNTLNTSLPMGKTNDLTPRKKSTISALFQNTDMSQRKISRKMCISQASVSQIKKKLENGEEFAANRIGKCGAERKTSQRVDRKFVNFCKQNRKMSILQITNELKTHDLVVSERTVRRRLYEEGVKCHRPSRQPLLTTEMKQK